ncbi:MAG TPA: hypothetical protein VMM16_07710 [Verrucomicrobiae bacterium]|nr:hypothetical protein [Verrucomicrobiae bacterium]
MKIQTLQVPRAKKQPASANPPTTSAAGQREPQAVQIKPSLAEDQRRRTQRVLLRVRANIHVAVQGKAATIDAATLSVNPHGAVVVMNQNLPADTHVVLEHLGTRERISCKVARPPRPMAEGYHVPLEFESPSPEFWKIDFPPSDWRPDNT